jgi:hypothetical protein
MVKGRLQGMPIRSASRDRREGLLGGLLGLLGSDGSLTEVENGRDAWNGQISCRRIESVSTAGSPESVLESLVDGLQVGSTLGASAHSSDGL